MSMAHRPSTTDMTWRGVTGTVMAGDTHGALPHGPQLSQAEPRVDLEDDEDHKVLCVVIKDIKMYSLSRGYLRDWSRLFTRLPLIYCVGPVADLKFGPSIVSKIEKIQLGSSAVVFYFILFVIRGGCHQLGNKSRAKVSPLALALASCPSSLHSGRCVCPSGPFPFLHLHLHSRSDISLPCLL
jgi:hypothetical protein